MTNDLARRVHGWHVGEGRLLPLADLRHASSRPATGRGVFMADPVIYRRIRRPDAALVARAASRPMSDLYEGLPPERRAAALMSPRMRPLVQGLRIAGPAVTALCAPGDNLMMHKALALARRGDVLVVAAGAPPGAQWGTLAAAYAEHVGLAGVVVAGSVRDADDLVARRYPVWCTAISPDHPDKRGAGSVNVPVVCDGVLVYPGDIICADGDGVLAVRPEDLAAAVTSAERRHAHEAESLAAIATGRTLFDVHDLQAALDRCAIPEHDAAWPGDAAV